MKFLLFALPLLLLFSCAKQEDPIINLTVIQNSSEQFVLTANLEKINPSKLSIVGFSSGMSPNHYIQENQIKTEDIKSKTVQLTMSSSNFVAGQTYYFRCFICTKTGKLIRSAAVTFIKEISAPCNLVNNFFTVEGSGGSGILENGPTNNATLTSTSGGGLYKHYSVQFGSAMYKFIFKGNPTSQIYTTSSSTSSIGLGQVCIQNTSSGAIVYSGQDVYVTDNNNGTFTIAKCPYQTYDWFYFPTDILLSFKVTGNY